MDAWESRLSYCEDMCANEWMLCKHGPGDLGIVLKCHNALHLVDKTKWHLRDKAKIHKLMYSMP